MEQVLTTATEAVLQGVPGWASALLNPMEAFWAEPTLEWLTKHIFLKRVFTVPSTETSLSVDIRRMRAMDDLLQRQTGRVRNIVRSNNMVVFKDVDPILKAFEGCWLYLSRFCDILDGGQDSFRTMKDFIPPGQKMPPNTKNPLAVHDGSIELPANVFDVAPDINHRLRGQTDLRHEVAEFRERIRAEEMEEEDDDDDDDDDDDEIVVVSESVRDRSRIQPRPIMPATDVTFEMQDSKY